MKEFEVSLTKTLAKGLRPFPETPDSPLFLEELLNLMPSELALRPHEDIAALLPFIQGWPWPRVIDSKNRVMSFRSDIDFSGSVLRMQQFNFNSGGWSGGPSFDLSVPHPHTNVAVDFADFGLFCVVSTYNPDAPAVPLVRTYLLSPDGSTLVESNSPAFGTGCNFRQQFVGGNIFDPVNGYKPNDVRWSAIGSYEFDLSQDTARTAGRKQEIFTRSVGSVEPIIQRILPLHEGPVIYSDAGKAIMLPEMVGETFTYGDIPIAGLGIRSGLHVAGDDYIHGYIDLNYDFWTLENSLFRVLERSGGQQVKRGYNPQIRDLFDEQQPVVVSYIPRDHRFYISNGKHCLIINKFGACSVHQCPSSVLQANDSKLYGTFLDNNDLEARLTVEATDFNARGIKTVESIIGGVIHNKPRFQSWFTTDYSMTNDDDWHSGRWITGGPRAEAAVRTSALAFKIRAKIDDYHGAQLQSLDVNVKFPDNRFRRGIAAQTTGEVRGGDQPSGGQ